MIIEIFSFSFVLDSRGMRQIILGCALLHLIMMASTKGLIPSWNDSAHIKDEQFSYISNMLSIDSKRLNPEGLSTKYLHSRLEPIRTINKGTANVYLKEPPVPSYEEAMSEILESESNHKLSRREIRRNLDQYKTKENWILEDNPAGRLSVVLLLSRKLITQERRSEYSPFTSVQKHPHPHQGSLSRDKPRSLKAVVADGMEAPLWNVGFPIFRRGGGGTPQPPALIEVQISTPDGQSYYTVSPAPFYNMNYLIGDLMSVDNGDNDPPPLRCLRRNGSCSLYDEMEAAAYTTRWEL
ncbi:uncharacterized protein [Apostichopus japonicus]|uniref:uncharacterized protein isoform X2 n=1 Tax=Stichopus japonicus TaxID=307972 RepID=UPI003AB160EF